MKLCQEWLFELEVRDRPTDRLTLIPIELLSQLKNLIEPQVPISWLKYINNEEYITNEECRLNTLIDYQFYIAVDLCCRKLACFQQVGGWVEAGSSRAWQ